MRVFLRSSRRAALRAATVLLGALSLTAAGTVTAAQAQPKPGPQRQAPGAIRAAPLAPVGWVESGSSGVNSLTGGQGVATLEDGTVLYRGLGSIPLALRIRGWNHVGDLDTARGYVFDAYQGGDAATSKMFYVTTPDGQRYSYDHALDAGEKLNNSFASISPDGQWLVSGEWGDQDRLRVFPAPILNGATPPNGGSIRQAGPITFDHPVRNVQGCDFVTATRLLCASDDAGGDLWPDQRPLLQVDLPRPLDGSPVTGQVTSLGPIPQRSVCQGEFEVEGVDYDPNAQVLRVEVVPPGVCKVSTTVYRYRPAGS